MLAFSHDGGLLSRLFVQQGGEEAAAVPTILGQEPQQASGQLKERRPADARLSADEL